MSIFNTIRRREGDLFLIAGPCVIESERHALMMAHSIARIADRLDIPYVFKASYDKANRSSARSFRGIGMDEGLRILQRVKDEVGVPVITDIHESEQVAAVAEVADILQIPAFLCRQTDLLQAAAESGRVVNVKKGQFLAPHDMLNVIDKARAAAREAGGQPGGREGAGTRREARRSREARPRPLLRRRRAFRRAAQLPQRVAGAGRITVADGLERCAPSGSAGRICRICAGLRPRHGRGMRAAGR